MSTYKEKISDIYTMMGQGKAMDAFEKYYHENVVMTELGGEPRKGKAANREYEQKFFASLKAVHGMSVDAITSDEANKVTMVESSMDAEFVDGNRMKMSQVAVQKWEGDHIVNETFYHNMNAPKH
jgi:hypothetical protein